MVGHCAYEVCPRGYAHAYAQLQRYAGGHLYGVKVVHVYYVVYIPHVDYVGYEAVADALDQVIPPGGAAGKQGHSIRLHGGDSDAAEFLQPL